MQTFSNEAEPSKCVLVCESLLSLHMYEIARRGVTYFEWSGERTCHVLHRKVGLQRWWWGPQRSEQVVVSSVGSGRVPFALTTFSQSGSRRPFERLSLWFYVRVPYSNTHRQDVLQIIFLLDVGRVQSSCRCAVFSFFHYFKVVRTIIHLSSQHMVDICTHVYYIPYIIYHINIDIDLCDFSESLSKRNITLKATTTTKSAIAGLSSEKLCVIYLIHNDTRSWMTRRGQNGYQTATAAPSNEK